jgi:hypothetical protein
VRPGSAAIALSRSLTAPPAAAFLRGQPALDETWGRENSISIVAANKPVNASAFDLLVPRDISVRLALALAGAPTARRGSGYTVSLRIGG